jgi:NADH-quinone oxidoreductase subunit J
MGWVFLVTAVLAVVSGLMVVLQRNPIYSAVALVLNLACVAVFYLLLNAEFLFAVQLIVYAGAIMVLFLFVITLLAPGKEETRDDPLARLRVPAAVLGVIVVAVLIGILSSSAIVGKGGLISYADLGTPATVGQALYTRFVFPFEITSVLLLVAIVGALVLARRPARKRDGAGRAGEALDATSRPRDAASPPLTTVASRTNAGGSLDVTRHQERR